MVLFIKHIDIEGPGLVKNFIQKEGFKVNIVDLSKDQALPSIDDCEGVISLGGPMSVYDTDKYPFLLEEEKFIKEVVKDKIPFLGICLGSQMLAKASGARIHKSPVEEIGWFEVFLDGEATEDALFKNLKNKLSVFQWHEDTFEVPKRGKLIASGIGCRNQALRVGDYAWGVQFHPEITVKLIKSWVDYYPNSLSKDKLLHGYFKVQEAYLKQARTICSNFATVIKQRREFLMKKNQPPIF